MALPKTCDEIFEILPDQFLPEKAKGVDVSFQYNISGPTGGEWYCKVKDQKCEVAKGIIDNPTATFIIGDDDFVKLMNGNLNPMMAMASRKLKIQGAMMKTQLIGKVFAKPEA